MGAINAEDLPCLEVNVYLGRKQRSPRINSAQDYMDIYAIFGFVRSMLGNINTIALVDENQLKWANVVVYLLLRFTVQMNVSKIENYMRSLCAHSWTRPDEIEVLHNIRYIPEPVYRFTMDFKSFVAERNTPFVFRLPSPDVIPRRSIIGTISQFSFSQCRTKTFACGSIALYAMIFAKWLHPAFWSLRHVDSIVMNGLKYAGRYSHNEHLKGLDDVVEQLKSMCPELCLRPVDEMYCYDKNDSTPIATAVASISSRFCPTYLLLTAITEGQRVGHHTFLFFEGGVWYWLEPLRCSETTMSPKQCPATGGGPVLRVFETSERFLMFAKHELMSTTWSLIRVDETRWSCIEPNVFRCRRPILTSGPIQRVMSPNQPSVIEQDPDTHEWRIMYAIDDDNKLIKLDKPIRNPFSISLMPRSTVYTTVPLREKSIIHVRDVRLESTRHVNYVTFDSHNYIKQSPFEDPAIWMTEDGHACLVGHQGAWIAHHMRINNVKFNVRWVSGDSGLYLMILLDLTAGSELILTS